jgi:hypothetical protein
LQRVRELEELYDKKLQLEAPVQYWKQRAMNLKAEGNKWLKWLVGFSMLAVILLFLVLFFISNGTIKELFFTLVLQIIKSR